MEQREKLFLYEALVITCAILAVFATIVFASNLVLSNTVQVQFEELTKTRLEMETLRNEVAAIRQTGMDNELLKCQLNILMTASRSGWRVAHVMLANNVLEGCER
jgi:hypothetical protein